jgi:pSer/pThr/pTyr-binding forkhead associated (FHA) protein
VCHNCHTILIDLDSTNGTFVNSELVSNHVLADGDRITIDRQSLYVRYSIEYCELDKTTRGSSDTIQSAAGAIKRALASIRHQLGDGDTDLLPTLREDVPTEIGIVDDR